ncbi:angiopoietin-2-like [Physella acuta]|uniref:angiopoietin-2-like n=1 Tax=Physella acuta TaxID=109671 RepID=UPI0027DD9305|nr:angiopoietin-2-like [Physella acuta]
MILQAKMGVVLYATIPNVLGQGQLLVRLYSEVRWVLLPSELVPFQQFFSLKWATGLQGGVVSLAHTRLDISLEREYYMEGKVLFCAKLHCVENTREDNEILALVNMSVYRISELEGKIVLASVLESDSRVRDYKVTGSKVDGKFSKAIGELTVSFTKPSDCFSTVFGCDVYYTNKRGLIEMKENKTKPVGQDNRKPLMLMTLEAKTPEFDKTIDKMSDFLKTFKYSDKLNSADLKMNLQFSSDDRRSNQTVDLIQRGRELSLEQRVDTLVNLTNAMENRLNSLLIDDVSKIQKLEKKIMNITNAYNEIVNRVDKTNQELSHFKSNVTEIFLKTTQQTEANNKTLEKQIKSVQNVSTLYNILHKQLEKLNYSVVNVSFVIQNLSQESNHSEVLSKTMHDFKIDLLNVIKEMIKNSTAVVEQRQNIRIQQLEENNKMYSEAQARKLHDLMTAVSHLNNTDMHFNASMEKIESLMQNLMNESDQSNVLISGLREQLKCANMNNSVLADMTEAGVDVSRTLCDTKTDGGGWIIIQRRIKGDVNFTRTWNDYKNGFGSTSGDFWIGNDVISHLTDSGYNELRFDMKYKGKDYYAVYRGFEVENEAAKYKMSYKSFSGGNVGDVFIYHKGMKFTTIDSDNDLRSSTNCAVDKRGGWWYTNCHNVNLNGEWASRVGYKGINWISITRSSDSLDFVEMKLRQM